MKRALFLILFFRVVPPVPAPMRLAFLVVSIVGGLVLAIGATDMRGVLGPLFLLQVFAASSGFAIPARRGHYDLLLTSGVPRPCIAAAHLVASTTPGVVCWLAVAALEAATHRGEAMVSAASGTVVALVIISTLSWAMTVPFPRLTGAMVWVMVFAVAGNHAAVPALFRPLVMPWLLIGHDIAVAGPIPAGVATFVVVVALGAAMSWICRADISLQVAR
jgi:hypothetical protein